MCVFKEKLHVSRAEFLNLIFELFKIIALFEILKRL